MKPKTQALANEVNELIRIGKGNSARSLLKNISTGTTPRSLRAVFAQLCWRVDLPTLGLKLLDSTVRSERKQKTEATVREKAEYAACLIGLGAEKEAFHLLQSLSEADLPRIQFYKALALMPQWDYEAAIPYLKEYLGSPDLKIYDQIVAGINLAACYVHQKELVQAQLLLNQLLHSTAELQMRLANAETLKLCAEHFILLQDWRRAELYLAKAETVLGKSNTSPYLFIRKWRAIIEVLKNGPEKLPLVDEVRKEAQKMDLGETLRECDRIEANCLKSEWLYTKLYYGTPHEKYREQLIQECHTRIAESYLWHPGGGNAKGETPGEAQKKLELYPRPNYLGKDRDFNALDLRLLTVLCSDFYRPLRVAEVHALLYPGEYFNSFSSPGRVRTAVYQLRKTLSKHRLPLKLVESGGSYSLKGGAGFCIHLRLQGVKLATTDPIELAIDQWRPQGRFTAEELGGYLKISTRSAQRHLHSLVERGYAKKVGAGSVVLYQRIKIGD